MWSNIRSVLLVLQVLWFLVNAGTNKGITASGYKTSLGVHKDEITTSGNWPKNIVYTSVVEYKDDVSQFSDAQLAGLVQQAWNEMTELHARWAATCRNKGQKDYVVGRRPNMMSIFAMGKRLYISSSIKASTPNVLLRSKIDSSKAPTITQALQACRVAWNTKTKGSVEDPDMLHKTRGSCAEIMATALVLKDTNKLPYDTGLNVRMVAYGAGDTANPTAISLFNPCGSALTAKDDTIGCHQFVGWQNINIIGKDQKIERVDAPAPSDYIDISLKDVWEIKVEFTE